MNDVGQSLKGFDPWSGAEAEQFRHETTVNTLAVFAPDSDYWLWPQHEEDQLELLKAQKGLGTLRVTGSRMDRILMRVGGVLWRWVR